MTGFDHPLLDHTTGDYACTRTDQKPVIDGAFTRYGSVAAAAGLSTNAFLAGDEQMAATLAADAGKASATDLQTRFDGSGAR